LGCERNREVAVSELPCHISVLFGVPKGIRTPFASVKATLCTLTVPSRMNSVRSGVHPAVADTILGHGGKKKSLQGVYMTISDDDLIRCIDMMKFDIGETEIRVKK
jgi:hypothetical protein